MEQWGADGLDNKTCRDCRGLEDSYLFIDQCRFAKYSADSKILAEPYITRMPVSEEQGDKLASPLAAAGLPGMPQGKEESRCVLAVPGGVGRSKEE